MSNEDGSSNDVDKDDRYMVMKGASPTSAIVSAFNSISSCNNGTINEDCRYMVMKEVGPSAIHLCNNGTISAESATPNERRFPSARRLRVQNATSVLIRQNVQEGQGAVRVFQMSGNKKQ